MNMLLVLAELDFGDVFGQILPRALEVLTQLIATLITLFIVYKLAWKPLRKFVKERQEYIETNIKDAEKTKQEAEINLEKSSVVLKQAQAEYKETVNAAKLDALKTQEEMLLKADNEAKRRIEVARAQIENDKEKAKEDIEKEIVDVALIVAKEVIGREINETDNRKMIKEFVEDINS